VEYRKALHKALALDLTRPHFRQGNSVKFDTQANEILINPHQALLNKGILKVHLYTFKFINVYQLL